MTHNLHGFVSFHSSGTIRQDCKDGSYLVEDSLGDLEQINRPDIITEADDADNEIGVHDPVIALHPSFPYSYAPGIITIQTSLCSPHRYLKPVLESTMYQKLMTDKLLYVLIDWVGGPDGKIFGSGSWCTEVYSSGLGECK